MLVAGDPQTLVANLVNDERTILQGHVLQAALYDVVAMCVDAQAHDARLQCLHNERDLVGAPADLDDTLH